MTGLSALLLLLISACSSLFYHPDRVLYYPPKKLGYTEKEISFKTSDGLNLVGWFLPSKTLPSKGTIIQFHGNAENMSSHYVSLVWLVDHGYHLFTFDYRGYGKSEGSPSQEGTLQDALAALDQARALDPKAPRFIVAGQSLGGVIAMNALESYPQKEKVHLVLLESTFQSYDDIAKSFLQRHWMTWIFHPLGPLLVSDRYSSDSALKKNQIPLLVVHDHRDPVIPYLYGKKIYETATGPKQFWELDQGGHVSAFHPKNLEIRKKFVEMLDSLPQFSGSATSNQTGQ